MKKIILVIVIALVVSVVTLVAVNFRSVYFVDGSTGEKTKLTSFWLKQNEIEIKDRWFNDFEEGTISGIIVIEDSKEYAYIPYAFTKIDSDGDLHDFYKSEIISKRVKGVTWNKKEGIENLIIEFDNELKLDVAVGSYSGTSYDHTEYGFGLYSFPLFYNTGELYYHLVFAESSRVGIREGFNNGVPTYILQEIIYTEATISIGDNDVTIFMPLQFVGGVGSQDINETDHYYFDYNGNNIILEADFIPVP